MNAKLQTLIYSVLVLLLTKFLVLPGWAEHKRLNSELKQTSQTVAAMQENVRLVKAMPSMPIVLQGTAQALSSTVNSWTGTQRQYGVQITQITTQLPPAGQTRIPLSALIETDPLTKLPIQKLQIKGQYTSLKDFTRYLAQEYAAERGVVINSLSMQGETFEIAASIYSKGS